MLEITAEGWVAIIGAIGILATTVAGAAVMVIVALGQLNKKVDAAAQRREEIATTVLNPSTAVVSAPPVAPPKE